MAKKGPSKPTDAVQRLLAEKHQIEQWLERLNSAGDTTPGHVREKVQSDYRKRLVEIVGELQEHRDNLSATLDEARRRQDDLARKEEAASERLSEAELRHTVGEYDEKKWAALKADILESLVKVREGLKEANAQIAALEEIAAVVDDQPAGLTPTGEPDEEVNLGGMQVSLDDVDAGTAAAKAAREATPERPRPKPKQTDAFDELAFLKSVTAGDATVRPRPSGGVARPRQDTKPPVKEPPRPPRRSGASEIGAEGVEALLQEPTQPSKGTAGKTLKCAECGANNLPTEWYCERCGAELAAL